MTQTQWGNSNKSSSMQLTINEIVAAMDSHFGKEYDIPVSYSVNIKEFYHDLNLVLNNLEKSIDKFSIDNSLTIKESRRIYGVLSFQWFMRKIELQSNLLSREFARKIRWGSNCEKNEESEE